MKLLSNLPTPLQPRLPRLSLPRLSIPLLSLALLGSLPAQGLHIGPEDPGTQLPGTRPQVPQVPPIRRVRLLSLNVQTRIQDGLASTELRQVFFNEGNRVAEGTWILPLPKGASVDRFTMTVNGKEMVSEVLGAGQARQVYERIVRQQRDPGLLEYMGNGCLRARIFPIPIKGEVKVMVRYRQVLPETSGLYQWSFPLRSATVGGEMAEKVSLDLQIHSRQAIKNVYSPSQDIHILRRGDHEARASLELASGQIPQRDLTLFYGLADGAFGLNLLTFRKKGQPGYFMLMLSPKQAWEETERQQKCVTFVLDTSGSMQGQKIEQARKALRFFLGSLHADDWFNIIPFSTGAAPFFDEPVVHNEKNHESASSRIAGLVARGGTNIGDSLARALGARTPEGVVSVTVFLTDGLPTVGTTNVKTLLAQIRSSNQGASRIFVFGVGPDVNTQLLDKIAKESRGERDYVGENEDIEVKTAALFTKLSHPVLSGVSLDCKGIQGFDLVPSRTPDLFKGSRLLVLGRYKGEGSHAITLKGKMGKTEQRFVFEGKFEKEAKQHDFIPTLWAQKRVAVLLDAIRLNGPKGELLKEVRRLGREFHIVTPYTSHLILEDQDRATVGPRGIQLGGGRTAQRSGGPGGNYRGPGDVPPPTTGGPRTPAPRAGARTAPGPLTGPTPPAPNRPGTATGSDQFFMGPYRHRMSRKDQLERILRELQRLGVLAKDSSIEELKASARSVARDLQRAERRLAGLGSGSPVGKKAVDESRYLLDLLSGVQRRGSKATLLFSQRIRDRSFQLRGGVWTDSRLEEKRVEKLRKLEVKAFSKKYFDLLHSHPELKDYFAFSTRIIVVLDDMVVTVR